MQYRKLGNSGLEVSAVGLGTNNFGRRMDPEASATIIRAAIEQGVTFIDTANLYSAGQSEDYIGRALEGSRDKVILATKAGGAMEAGPNGRGNSRKHIMDQAEKSLRRLRTDYVDLFQVHWPDPTTPIEETLRALDDLVRQGKVRYIGCSNFSAWQVCEAVWTSRHLGLNSFVSAQNEYNLLNRTVEPELLPFCKAYNMGIIPYYPLASGFLTGKYRAGEPLPAGARLSAGGPFQGRFLNEKNYQTLDVLEQFSRERGHTVGELAIAWLLAQPQVSSVIAGATKVEQVKANVVAGEWLLNSEDLKELGERLGAGA